ncbi:endonuclease III [Peptococcaceae bacterium]|nr:endonuclease III [Peptococcaceae bacterium]
MVIKKRCQKIIELLHTAYTNVKCALEFKNTFELLIAVILSAQSTDKQVNIITKRLFKKYKTPEDFAKLTYEKLASEIKGCGLHNNKSKAIINTCRILIEKFDGNVPRDRKLLEELPGVGRKTAGVILAIGFNKPVLPVDTHVHRVSKRLGIASGKNPLKTEEELMRCIPKELWKDAHLLFIQHGREICTARSPKCSACVVESLCAKSGLS